MKLTKSLFLAFAGLGLFACSNEEVAENQYPEGVGAVSIKIVSPDMSRTSNATTGNKTVAVEPQGDVTIKLTADKGGNTITLSQEEWKNGKTVTFWNVETPRSVTVTMNGGVESYDNINIKGDTPELQVLPAAIPVYGSTTTFTATTNTGSPDIDSGYEAGAQAGDQNKKYQIWTASVNLEIPVARLEVSGITHVTHTGVDPDKCKYATLTIDGVYLDNVKPTNSASRTDYQFIGEGVGTGAEAILREEIKGSPSFLDASVWPAEPEQAYAFNFYGASEDEKSAAEAKEDAAEKSAAIQALNPKFKIYFATATGSSQPVTQPRFAMITKYKDGDGNEIVLQNGKIYRITEAELTDENIIGDEGGNTLYGITVTVVEAAWTPVDIEADWAE